VACTGTEFCKLAITETKGFARWLVEEMEGRMPGFDQQIKLHVTGCPNSCGQHWIADVGLEGKKIKQDGKLADAWSFALGGALGVHAGVARVVNYRCLSATFPMPWSGCCGTTSQHARETRICAPGSPIDPIQIQRPAARRAGRACAA
jgi:sulfite reductase beta subunit-like hemoprotein